MFADNVYSLVGSFFSGICKYLCFDDNFYSNIDSSFSVNCSCYSINCSWYATESNCNNYRGISLLSIAGKVFAKVVLPRLQVLASTVYPEAQSGFRAEMSTIDMIFATRQLQEKCREQQMPLYIAFIDLTKAFDLVSKVEFFKCLRGLDTQKNF